MLTTCNCLQVTVFAGCCRKFSLHDLLQKFLNLQALENSRPYWTTEGLNTYLTFPLLSIISITTYSPFDTAHIFSLSFFFLPATRSFTLVSFHSYQHFDWQFKRHNHNSAFPNRPELPSVAIGEWRFSKQTRSRLENLFQLKVWSTQTKNRWRV